MKSGIKHKSCCYGKTINITAWCNQMFLEQHFIPLVPQQFDQELNFYSIKTFCSFIILLWLHLIPNIQKKSSSYHFHQYNSHRFPHQSLFSLFNKTKQNNKKNLHGIHLLSRTHKAQRHLVSPSEDGRKQKVTVFPRTVANRSHWRRLRKMSEWQLIHLHAFKIC